MALRSGAGRAIGLWVVLALIALLALPPHLAVPVMLAGAVVIGGVALGRSVKRQRARRARVLQELRDRGLQLRSMTVHPWGGVIEFVAADPSGQEVLGALRGDVFTIDERRWLN